MPICRRMGGSDHRQNYGFQTKGLIRLVILAHKTDSVCYGLAKLGLRFENPRMDDLSVEDILGADGAIARRIEKYEQRPQQIHMANAVAEALEHKKKLVVEAGTGVGKSFAYLVPAILHATNGQSKPQSNNEPDKEEGKPSPRIVISTHTISLQEQLMAKDLPLLNSVIPREFSSVLVKGRSNYVSLRRLAIASQRSVSMLSAEEEIRHLQIINDWAQTTVDGSRSSLPVKPLVSVWDEVASDSGNCLGRKCPTYKECLYYLARRRMDHAQILVVNHALFFSDLALRELGVSLLPEYSAVVFDECHTVESVASDHLGISISNTQLNYTLRKLYNPLTNKGLLVALGLKTVQKMAYDCFEAVDDLVADISGWIEKFGGNNNRVTEKHIVTDRLTPKLKELCKNLERFGKNLDNANAKQDITSAQNRLVALSESLTAWLNQTQDDSAYWIEKSNVRSGTKITLRCSPIDVASQLRKLLFANVPTVVMASATLATGRESSSTNHPAASNVARSVGSKRPTQTKDAFEFFKSRIGCGKARSLQLGSPFNYKEQAELILLADMPDPSSRREDFEKQLPLMIQHYTELSEGKAFVLFTSYDLLRRTVQKLTPWMNRKQLSIYSQADGTPRGQLLEQFKKNPHGILFGTDSFWQGVDVPGEALSNVIITKLPFSVPNHPLLAARMEHIRESGGVPFRDYQLPEAVIKLKQGFGRLIRTQTDSGMVVICDPRIKTKPYGRTFLNALPETTIRYDSAQRIIERRAAKNNS